MIVPGRGKSWQSQKPLCCNSFLRTPTPSKNNLDLLGSQATKAGSDRCSFLVNQCRRPPRKTRRSQRRSVFIVPLCLTASPPHPSTPNHILTSAVRMQDTDRSPSGSDTYTRAGGQSSTRPNVTAGCGRQNQNQKQAAAGARANLQNTGAMERHHAGPGWVRHCGATALRRRRPDLFPKEDLLAVAAHTDFERQPQSKRSAADCGGDLPEETRARGGFERHGSAWLHISRPSAGIVLAYRLLVCSAFFPEGEQRWDEACICIGCTVQSCASWHHLQTFYRTSSDWASKSRKTARGNPGELNWHLVRHPCLGTQCRRHELSRSLLMATLCFTVECTPTSGVLLTARDTVPHSAGPRPP